MAYDRINLLIPTYRRCRKTSKKTPEGNDLWEGKLVTCLQTSMESTELPTSEVIDYTFMVNEKDTATMNFLQWRMQGYKFQILTENEPTPHLAKFYNRLYDETKFNAPGTLVSLIGDDMKFLTKGYDQRILAEVNKKVGCCFVYCNDAYMAGPNCAVNLFTTRKYVEATGKPFMRPDYKAEMMDKIYSRVGDVINVGVYLSDVIIEHDHEGKKPEHLWDECFKRLTPIQRAAHANPGKGDGSPDMHAYVNEIVKTLKSKGIG